MIQYDKTMTHVPSCAGGQTAACTPTTSARLRLAQTEHVLLDPLIDVVAVAATFVIVVFSIIITIVFI
jgi:hypothetical protein